MAGEIENENTNNNFSVNQFLRSLTNPVRNYGAGANYVRNVSLSVLPDNDYILSQSGAILNTEGGDDYVQNFPDNLLLTEDNDIFLTETGETFQFEDDVFLFTEAGDTYTTELGEILIAS